MLYTNHYTMRPDMDAGPGIEPGFQAYETSELPLFYPAVVW